MLDPLSMGLIMGGAGALKTALFDAPAANRARKREAAFEKMSPWTGVRGDTSKIKEPDYFGNAMQFGMTGAAMGQNLATQAATTKMNEALTGYLNRGGGPVRVGVDPTQGMAGLSGTMFGQDYSVNPWARQRGFGL